MLHLILIRGTTTSYVLLAVRVVGISSLMFSPVLNKLGLYLFCNLQQGANKLKGASKSLRDLVTAVTAVYRNYSVDQLRLVHALIYVVYRQILENLACNQYDLPHTGIQTRQQGGVKLDDRNIPYDVVRAARTLHIVIDTLK